MVYLSRIYTKRGDDGTTSLGDGARVPKDDLRIEAFGTSDELNSVLGLLYSTEPEFPERELIAAVLNDLFDVGADLCVPQAGESEPQGRLRITSAHVQKLEAAVDRLNADLKPLKSFVLPGGTPAAAWCHLARTVCRRAERCTVSLANREFVNPHVLMYLNRLSDLLFVLARALNAEGTGDVLWEPGKGGATDPT